MAELPNDLDELALAKSHPKEDIQTHTNSLLANLALFKTLYPNLLKEKDWDGWDILEKACTYHDLGKLNRKFQEKLRPGGKRFVDEIPHGLLSLAFINDKELKNMGYNNENIQLLFHAVAYHHDRKLPESNADIEKEFAGLSLPFERFVYDKLPKKCIISKIINQRYFYVGQIIYEGDGDVFFRFIKIKGLLNRLDYAASAYIPVENTNDFLEEAMAGLMANWQKPNPNARWNEMQEYMLSNRDKNVIVIAQTGMGKTEAGLLWIGNHKGFFTLPLKSAINAIYDRIIDCIVVENKEDRVGLLHSDTFIRYLEQSKSDGGERDISTYEAKTKQLSLPLTICTLDQLFNFVFRYRGFEQLLVTLSYSKVIIDEVQMYSPGLISYLVLGLHYITRLGGKFAILTATLPEFLENLLKEEGIEFEQHKEFTNDRIRHSLKVVDNPINVEDIMSIRQRYGGKKILVICNTIKTAVSMYHQIRKLDEEQQVHLLHSHFTKTDRATKEKQILKMGHKENRESCIWIATQIVEASLDIDFDLLFTELSDLNGLFQRMGRCYRDRDLSNLQYNCFVFTGGTKRCSGVGLFIDEKIHRMSKEALAGHDGVIDEKQKIKMVKLLYTKEKLPEYYAVIKENIKYVKSFEAGELSKSEAIIKFREIDTISVIPRSVYELHKLEISVAINDLRDSGVDKDKARVIRAKARSRLIGYTVDIASYLGQSMEIKTKKINDYEQMFIAECDYNREEGIIRPVLKPKAEIQDFSAHSF